jgi:hypothetical protein
LSLTEGEKEKLAVERGQNKKEIVLDQIGKKEMEGTHIVVVVVAWQLDS